MSDWDSYSSAQLKEELANEKLPALREAGLISESKIEFLEDYRQGYEPRQAPHYREDRQAIYYFNSVSYVEEVRKEVGKTLSKAVRNGNQTVINHAIGIVNGEDGPSQFAQYLMLEDLIHGDEFRIFVFTGGQGGGKSYLSYVLGKFKKNLCERDGIPVHVVTNSLSAVELNPELDLVESPQELWEYRLEHDGHIVWIMDEASSFFDSAGAGNMAQMKKFKPFLRKLRKFEIIPIIVSHRTKDIGTDVRSLDSTVFIHKPDEDTAIFYGNETDGGLEDKMFEIHGFSTDDRYDYESDDPFITWNWEGIDSLVEMFEDSYKLRDLWEEYGPVRGLDEVSHKLEQKSDLEEKRQRLIREVYEMDYSESEVAEMAGVSRSKVNRIVGSSD